MSKDGEINQFTMIFESALVTKRKTQEVIETIKAISEFESKLHYENDDTIHNLEKRNLNKMTKTKVNDVEANSQELAFTYLPYWDTKIGGNSKEDDTKKALEWFELSAIEAHNICRKINCMTFRDFIMYYRTNGKLFTHADVRIFNKYRSKT